MLRKIAFGFVFGVLLAAAIPVGADDGVMFAYHFEAGASQRYRLHFNAEADMHGAAISQLADMEVTVKCDSSVAGKHSMRMTFDKVEMSRAMFGNMEADPSGEQLVGHAVVFSVDDQGNVSGIKSAGYFEAWTQVRGALEPVVENWYVYLPSKKVPVGGEWKQENVKETQASGVEMTRNERFKFKEMKKLGSRECAFVEATIDNTFAGKTASPAGDFDVSGEGKGKYEFYFDPATGVIVKFSSKTDIEAESVPSKGSGEPMQTTIGYQFEKELL